MQCNSYYADDAKCAPVSSYANNFSCAAVDAILMIVSIFVVALISLISISISTGILIILLVILDNIKAGKQSTNLAIVHFIPLM
ncbi:hypothetical protein ACPWSR_02085 [Alloiococcus sp. CFN-8]|uniref:hypothetical protein n=1 Tax=Alloiococcus sp. CFN-8 TaxID=3416081 RepID=UPI003CE94669